MNISTNYASTAYRSNVSADLSQSKTPNTLQNATSQNTSTSLTPNFRQTYKSEFGFRTNEQGIFEKELNKAANLPLSYDINIKSVQSIAKELVAQDKGTSQSDIATLLNKYFSTLRAVESEFNTADNANLSRAEIAELNQGFSTQNGGFDDAIIRVYNNASELKQALRDEFFYALVIKQPKARFFKHFCAFWGAYVRVRFTQPLWILLADECRRA